MPAKSYKSILTLLVILFLAVALLVGVRLVLQRQLISKKAAVPGGPFLMTLTGPATTQLGQNLVVSLNFAGVLPSPSTDGLVSIGTRITYPNTQVVGPPTIQKVISDSGWNLAIQNVTPGPSTTTIEIAAVYFIPGHSPIGYVPAPTETLATLTFPTLNPGSFTLSFDPSVSQIYTKSQQDVLLYDPNNPSLDLVPATFTIAAIGPTLTPTPTVPSCLPENAVCDFNSLVNPCCADLSCIHQPGQDPWLGVCTKATSPSLTPTPTTAPEYVILYSVTNDGTNLIIDYEQHYNTNTVSHLLQANGTLTHNTGGLFPNTNRTTVTYPLSYFISGTVNPGTQVKLCHGNNYSICSSLVTIVGIATLTPTPTPTSVPPSLTPTPTSVVADRFESLTFSVKFQGTSINPSRTTTTVSLGLANNSGTNIYPVAVTYILGSQGVFTGTLFNSNFNYSIIPGTYTISVKGPSHLNKSFGQIVLNFGANSAPVSWYNIPLLAGDVFGDYSNPAPNNKLNTWDLGAFLSARTQDEVPVTPANQIYDLNFDGKISVLDLGLILTNRTQDEVLGDN